MSKINTTALSTLKESLSPLATVSLPGDPGYSVKRWARNAERPAAIVACPATNEDVLQLIAFVQGKAPYESQERLHLAVKGGGHTPSGASSSDGGLVIDLNPNMHNVRVDPEAKLAYVQGGAVWGDVDAATSPHGLASVSGTVSHTGVGGLILGGGFGWLCSQYGLVIDNLVQATVVTSDGRVLTASDSENKSLFWALRGGGGNFGLATEFVLNLHEQRPDLYSKTLVFPPPGILPLVSEVNAWLAVRSTLESAQIIFAVGPTGQPGVVLQLIYNGDPLEGASLFERFVKLGPLIDQSETIPYMKLNTLVDHMSEHGEFRLLQGNFIPARPEGLSAPFVANAFDAWLKLVTDHPTAARSIMAIELYHTDKLTSVPSDATAYIYRSPAHNVAYMIHWTDPAFTDQAPKVVLELDREFVEFRDQFLGKDAGRQGGYTNYLDLGSRNAGHEWLKSRFGDNHERLIEVKREYDPNNLFGRWFIEPKAL